MRQQEARAWIFDDSGPAADQRRTVLACLGVDEAAFQQRIRRTIEEVDERGAAAQTAFLTLAQRRGAASRATIAARRASDPAYDAWYRVSHARSIAKAQTAMALRRAEHKKSLDVA